MTILEALADPALFGTAFSGEDWQAWRVFLAALFGLPLTASPGLPVDALDRFRDHTGRTAGPLHPVPREGWAIVGRRGGKSRIAALVAVYLAAFRDYRTVLAPGERATLPIIATDRRQARAVLGYVNGLLASTPLLASLVANETAESVELTTGVTIEVHTCNFRSVRGYTMVGAILDEVAFYRSDDSATPDVELLHAIRPAMATVPGALLLGISSPYARRGVLWEAYRQHYGKDGDAVLVWQAPTVDMNPAVDRDVIAEAYLADEAVATAEYGAQFRRDIEAFIQREALEACICPGRHELPGLGSIRYVAFADPSGGAQDSFTLAIAHREVRGDQQIAVLDCVREVRPPFNPDAVVQDFAALLKSYGLVTVTGDRYAGEWPRERFAAHGVAYEPAEQTKSELYGAFLPLLNAGRVELLDVPRLHAQLLGLERRTSRAGRDAIDHGTGHDDVANVAAGALVAAAEPQGTGRVMAAGERTFEVPERITWRRGPEPF